MPAYITRVDAVGVYGDCDPEVGEDHVFQGDLFIGLDMMTPQRGSETSWVVSNGIIVSHHCEWTKAEKKIAAGEDWPILVTPVYDLETAFSAHEQRLIREGRFRYYLYLPEEHPVDRNLVADLRLIQPLAASGIANSTLWTCTGPELVEALRAKVIEFITRSLTA